MAAARTKGPRASATRRERYTEKRMATLPNSDKAVVDPAKLTAYCLNPDHPHGGPKARVFRAFLGLTAEHADLLRDALVNAARIEEAEERLEDAYGKRYEVRFALRGPNGNTAEVTSAWIVDTGENFPRLTSAYIKI